MENDQAPAESGKLLLHMGFFGNDYISMARTSTSMANLERCLSGLLKATNATAVIVPISIAPDLIPFIKGLNFALRYFARNIAEALPTEWEKLLARKSRQHPGVKFYSYDHAALLRSAASGTLEYIPRRLISDGYCLKTMPDKTETVCANPQNHLFWDLAHPSSIIHKAMADAITDFLHTGTSHFGRIFHTPN
ncbi:hypothetical protein DSO57_1008189 [Entomophthora muscae]|uniref:Uncharacterized protein n=1 Tax=Entomophthora muscae TaxID=34485 RepID=A0ACC2U5L3_9FUNG|nr:hypothetical protein DSO57_1008189 [Entomophthora muscae]